MNHSQTRNDMGQLHSKLIPSLYFKVSVFDLQTFYLNDLLIAYMFMTYKIFVSISVKT